MWDWDNWIKYFFKLSYNYTWMKLLWDRTTTKSETRRAVVGGKFSHSTHQHQCQHQQTSTPAHQQTSTSAPVFSLHIFTTELSICWNIIMEYLHHFKFLSCKDKDNTRRGDDVLAVSGHHQPNGRLVNKWFHWLLYCVSTNNLMTLALSFTYCWRRIIVRLIIASFFIWYSCSNCVEAFDCLPPYSLICIISSYCCQPHTYNVQ